MQRLIRGNEVVSDSASKGETVSERKLPANSAPCVVTDNGCLRWYAVHTQPNRELRAKSQLENQGYEVFLPRCLKTVRHARKLTNVAAPFFPRYLFVRLDLVQHRWRSVNGTFGVSSLVMQGEKPHPVCFKESLVVGTQVRLAAGPFAEQLGILDRLDDSGRVRVLLDIMGAAIPVYVERKFVVTA
jgi:transcription antitermination factor NusG